MNLLNLMVYLAETKRAYAPTPLEFATGYRHDRMLINDESANPRLICQQTTRIARGRI